MEDESNIRLAYATHEDIAACCPTETVLAVRVSSKLLLILFHFLSCQGSIWDSARSAKTGGGNWWTTEIPDPP